MCPVGTRIDSSLASWAGSYTSQLHESVNFLAVHLLIWINAAGSVLIDTPTQPHACWVTSGERLGCSEAQFPHRDIGLQIPSPLGWLTIIMVLT